MCCSLNSSYVFFSYFIFDSCRTYVVSLISYLFIVLHFIFIIIFIGPSPIGPSPCFRPMKGTCKPFLAQQNRPHDFCFRPKIGLSRLANQASCWPNSQPSARPVGPSPRTFCCRLLSLGQSSRSEHHRPTNSLLPRKPRRYSVHDPWQPSFCRKTSCDKTLSSNGSRHRPLPHAASGRPAARLHIGPKQSKNHQLG